MFIDAQFKKRKVMSNIKISYSQVKDSAVTEMYFEEIFEQGYEGNDPLFDLRHFLYPASPDPYIQVR